MRRIAAWMLVLALVFGMSATALAYDTYKLDENANGIKELQQRLIDLEYLDGKADGWFGKKTQAAVKRFQLVHDQEVTGIADDAMQQALYSDDAKKFPQVVMSLNELKDMMGEAGALGIRYDLSALESDGRSASCELNNYVVLNCDLLGDDI
ncbi:peptidoglycan-binding protein, partial [Eubacteriales bacterium OttesenSCG-928-N13]|nr:peptidoglycan-binding protein [Eubacteriales bacterium OttesenSCG-928-N13]